MKSNDYANKKDNLGYIYISCTKRNIFCTLVDSVNKKVKTSCSLRVPPYQNEYNERENIYTRGLLLGKLFAEKVIFFGYNKAVVHVSGTSKGRSGVVRSLSKTGVDICSMVLSTSTSHNGCRPSKARRKKFRSKVKGFN